MKKILKSFLSMSLIVAIVSTLLLPTQAQAKTKSLVADKDKVNVLDAIEAFENSGLDQILMPVSVGQTAHLLFNYNGDKFILWLKYKLLNETKGYGFEVRSFYKCIAECDLAKFDNCENDAGRTVVGEIQ